MNNNYAVTKMSKCYINIITFLFNFVNTFFYLLLPHEQQTYLRLLKLKIGATKLEMLSKLFLFSTNNRNVGNTDLSISKYQYLSN